MFDQSTLESPLDLFLKWEQQSPDRIFLRQPKGNQWITMTYAEAGVEARRMVSALRSMGLEKGDHIGILSKNCYHWIVTDIAIMMGGFVSIPYYASLSKKALKEVLLLSDLKALFIGKLDAWGDRAEALPEALNVITFPHYEGNAKIEIGSKWTDLIEQNAPAQELRRPDLDQLWTILFTSGTTGKPKGVMHSFRNPAIVVKIERETNFIGVNNMQGRDFFSFLPLNHVAERIGVELNCLTIGGTISFAESLDTFAQNLQETQPSLLFAVPRIWTKFYLGVLAKMPEQKIQRLYRIPIVSGIVKKKIKKALGMNRAEIVATGAAITPEFLKNWYKALGLHLIEAYGMTEVCGSICNGPDLDTPPDSVGRAVPYCDIKIDPETQEILMRAPYQMLGYYKAPEKTAEVIQDGWIYSGDRGTIDENGYLRVVGRVKDAFKTSKGQYIVPNPMEEVLAKNKYIEQVCVAGLACPQPLALINLSEQGQQADKQAVEHSLQKSLALVNAPLSNYHKISTVVIHQDNWSEHNQLLTPTLKVRRGKIDESFCKQYETWHDQKETIVWA
ncbi:MAG: AMP-binding protein [Bacteroidota bacterium]